jgi:hypothetical protein
VRIKGHEVKSGIRSGKGKGKARQRHVYVTGVNNEKGVFSDITSLSDLNPSVSLGLSEGGGLQWWCRGRGCLVVAVYNDWVMD